MVDVNGFIMENTFVTYNFNYFETVYFYKKMQVNLSRLIYVCRRAKKMVIPKKFLVTQAYELLR
jgi:hypothetical protein